MHRMQREIRKISEVVWPFGPSVSFYMQMQGAGAELSLAKRYDSVFCMCASFYLRLATTGRKYSWELKPSSTAVHPQQTVISPINTDGVAMTTAPTPPTGFLIASGEDLWTCLWKIHFSIVRLGFWTNKILQNINN